jgi:hypothetical protein
MATCMHDYSVVLYGQPLQCVLVKSLSNLFVRIVQQQTVMPLACIRMTAI